MTLTSALTLVGVLTAGGAAALVNTRVLDSAEGDATRTNRVELVEAERTGPRQGHDAAGSDAVSATSPPPTSPARPAYVHHRP